MKVRLPEESQPSHTAAIPVKVLLVNSAQMVREELRRLLETQSDITLVGEAESCQAGAEMVSRLSPDVAVIDLQKSGTCGAEGVGRLLAARPGLKIVALSMYADRRYLNECLNAGVRGYLLKECVYEELVDAVRAVAIDRKYLSRSLQPEGDAPDIGRRR